MDMKGDSIWLIIWDMRKMQIKVIMGCQFTPLRTPSVKKKKISVGKKVENLEPLWTAGRLYGKSVVIMENGMETSQSNWCRISSYLTSGYTTNSGDTSSIPGWRTRIPHAVGQLSSQAATAEHMGLN